MSRYVVTLRQLDRDISHAGIDLPELTLSDVDRAQLGVYISKLIDLAPRCEFPVAPELRIQGDAGSFLLKASHGQLRFESWSTRLSVRNPTSDFVLATIDGAPESDSSEIPGVKSAPSQAVQRWKFGLLIALIVAVNGFTVWQLVAPTPLPPSLVPPTTKLPEELGIETLQRFAGAYATGNAQGDRVLLISNSGEAKWQTLGPRGNVAEEQIIKVTAVDSREGRGLMADNHGLITKTGDGAVVVYFGDKYRRRDAGISR